MATTGLSLVKRLPRAFSLERSSHVYTLLFSANWTMTVKQLKCYSDDWWQRLWMPAQNPFRGFVRSEKGLKHKDCSESWYEIMRMRERTLIACLGQSRVSSQRLWSRGNICTLSWVGYRGLSLRNIAICPLIYIELTRFDWLIVNLIIKINKCSAPSGGNCWVWLCSTWLACTEAGRKQVAQ